MAAYRDAVAPLVAGLGGKRVSQGAGADLLEGRDDGRRIVLFDPSMDAIHAFWRSPEYQPVKELWRGHAGSLGRSGSVTWNGVGAPSRCDP